MAIPARFPSGVGNIGEWLNESLDINDFQDITTLARFPVQDPGNAPGRSDDPESRKKDDLKSRIVYLEVDGRFYEGSTLQRCIQAGDARSPFNRQPFTQSSIHRIDEFARAALTLDNHIKAKYRETHDGEEMPEEFDREDQLSQGFAFPKRVDVIPTQILRSWEDQGRLSGLSQELRARVDVRLNPQQRRESAPTDERESAPTDEFTMNFSYRNVLHEDADISFFQAVFIVAHCAFFLFTAFLDTVILCKNEEERFEHAFGCMEAAAGEIAAGNRMVYFG